jgi:predicted DCC family thiol-disulfide oxidoreductase YuxK
MTTQSIRAGWNRFFHEPTPATTLGVYRIFFGLMLLAYAALISSDLLIWYGDKGVLPLAESKFTPGGQGLNLLHFLPNTDNAVKAFFGVLVAAAFCVTIGFQTRIASIVAYLTLVSFHHRNVMLLHSGDFFLRIVSFWMMFADSGRAFSVDRLIRIARGKETQEPRFVRPWPMRMIQLQVCMLYFDAFLWKIRGETWMNGLAIYYSSRLVEFYRFPTPYVFEHLWTIKLMTWGTLVIEFALGFLLWIKDLRYWILLGGVILHLGIDWTMNIPMFAPIMMTAYITWIAPADLERFFAWARALFNRWTHFTAPIPVFYDGKCAFCMRSIEVLKRLDSLRRLRFINMHAPAAKTEFPDLNLDRGTMEMLLRDHEGKWFGGFDAYRVMAKHIPAFWLIVPLLFIPPIPTIGRQTYARIAGRRYCILPQMPQTQSAAGMAK